MNNDNRASSVKMHDSMSELTVSSVDGDELLPMEYLNTPTTPAATNCNPSTNVQSLALSSASSVHVGNTTVFSGNVTIANLTTESHETHVERGLGGVFKNKRRTKGLKNKKVMIFGSILVATIVLAIVIAFIVTNSSSASMNADFLTFTSTIQTPSTTTATTTTTTTTEKPMYILLPQPSSFKEALERNRIINCLSDPQCKL